MQVLTLDVTSVQVKNSAGEDKRDGVYITSANLEDLVGSRGTCNFQVCCSLFANFKTATWLDMGVTGHRCAGEMGS